MIDDADIALRLAVAALLGSLVGLERERLMWSAGVRTHMLVAVGSCLLMIVSAYGFAHAVAQPHVVLDPSRIAAQVVTGVGFLGAGSILLRGQAVRGLTTAASVWSVAALGLAAGGGLFFAAGVATVIMLVILAGLKPLEEAYRARVQSCVLQIRAERGALPLDEARRLLRVRGGQVRRAVVAHVGDDQEELVIQLVRVSRADVRAGSARLRTMAGVQSVALFDKRARQDAAADAPNEG